MWRSGEGSEGSQEELWRRGVVLIWLVALPPEKFQPVIYQGKVEEKTFKEVSLSGSTGYTSDFTYACQAVSAMSHDFDAPLWKEFQHTVKIKYDISILPGS